MTLAENFLGLEPLLVARLQEQLADLVPKVKVLTSADLAGVTEEQQVTPAVHVIYRAYKPVESRHDGKCARIEQTYIVVVATRNVRQLRSGEAARADAGEIGLRVLKALMGFRLNGTSKPLRLTDAPAAGFSGGFMYLPLSFTTELTVDNA